MTREKGEMIARGRTAEIFAWKDGQVLKLFLEDWPVRTDAAKEAETTRAAHKAGLPVPAVEGVVEVEGRRGIVFERVEGPIMTIAMVSKPWNFVRLARMMAELHAARHENDNSRPRFATEPHERDPAGCAGAVT